jgi:hypothetical protein
VSPDSFIAVKRVVAAAEDGQRKLWRDIAPAH